MHALTPRSAYGITWLGLGDVEELAPAVGSSFDGPPMTVTLGRAGADRPPDHPVDARRGCWALRDGHVLAVDRATRTATFYGSPISSDQLAHPYLAAVATVVNRWAGREAFHAGAFVAADRAWVVRGVRTAGKSTLMASLAARGHSVLSDDIAVTDGRNVFAGPRAVDLRSPPPAPVTTDLVRGGTRWRVRLAPAPARVPLAGWVFLEWGNQVRLHRLGQRELLGRLAAGRSWTHLESDPRLLLALAGAPAWVLERPRRWESHEPSIDVLTSAVTGAVAPRAALGVGAR